MRAPAGGRMRPPGAGCMHPALTMIAMRLAALYVADPPERWEALGFAVDDGHVDLGGVRVHLGQPGHGIVAWGFTEPVDEVDGLRTMSGCAPAPPRAHPNTATAIDHLVIVTPDFDRTASELPLKRVRETSRGRQGFRRAGPTILELVEAPQAPRTQFWGLTITVEDLDVLAARLGDLLGSIRDAIQPGRRIATLRSEADLTPHVAFMDPEPREVG
jgi:hypothetical protein